MQKSIFAVLTFLFQDPCNLPWHTVIAKSMLPFCQNLWGCVCPPILNGITVWGISWPWTQNIYVLFPKPLGYYFCLMERCSIIQTKLFLDGWEKLLLEDVFEPFFIYGCVLRQNCKKSPLPWLRSNPTHEFLGCYTVGMTHHLSSPDRLFLDAATQKGIH